MGPVRLLAGSRAAAGELRVLRTTPLADLIVAGVLILALLVCLVPPDSRDECHRQHQAHGLGGNAYDTWRRKGDKKSFWPLW